MSQRSGGDGVPVGAGGWLTGGVLGRVLQDEETEGWTDTLEHYSYYPEAQLRPVMCQLASLVVKANEKLGDNRAKRVVSAGTSSALLSCGQNKSNCHRARNQTGEKSCI